MIYDFVIKSKRIYVPPSKGRKGYYREDPREKSVLDFLKGILRMIVGAKKKDGFLTNEQRSYIHKSLKEVEPKMKYFKDQKQRMEIAKVLKQIRLELKGLETKKHEALKPKKKKNLTYEMSLGIKKLGYSEREIGEMSEDEAKAIYWNEIEKGGK